MADDSVGICAQALTLIGAGPISSFEGPDARSVAASQLYDPIVETLMGLHRWRFASASFELSRLVAAPTTRWEAKYTVPAGTMVIHNVIVNDCSIPFDRFDNEIHCDAQETDEVYCEVTREIAESYWPKYFVACVRLKLAAAFAIAVAHNEDRANVYEGQFIRQFTQAKLLDSQGRTAAKLQVGGLRAFVAGRP